ncbi:MAG: alpha/beta hydrolase [Clostridia bacterium]|nr:alpha/beta hydrolase [Clostridia bacterium]
MKKRLKWAIPTVLIAAILSAFFIYTGTYYHANAEAERYLISDGGVRVEQAEYGWFFDGPSETDALVFYPGAKVEETAYAPLCHRLAREGTDVFLVKMPFRLAFFGANKADKIDAFGKYERRYIGGHSLGGVFAASYAEKNSDKIDGLILLASYCTAKLDDGLKTVLIYGSEDTVLNAEKYRENLKNVPADAAEYVIEGGNHAQFGSYGMQKGDQPALITSEEQIEEAVAAIGGTVFESDRSP